MSDTREGVERNLTAKEIEGLRCSLSAATWPRINQWEIDALCRMAQALDAAQADARRLDAIDTRAVIINGLGKDLGWEARPMDSQGLNPSSWHTAKSLRAAIDSAMSTEREG